MILAVMLGVKKKLGGKIPSIKNLILLAYVTPGISPAVWPAVARYILYIIFQPRKSCIIQGFIIESLAGLNFH